ncbi:MAG TPA: glycosyltransferase family 4 protein [Ignavibacteria bacterium]|mgnify:CR=1 FL=1|nr:glycosyltransferase family 4 protein [Ignavibacteria bacterium]
MKILFLGRYNEASVLTGPEKVAKRIFNKCSHDFNTVFVTYFFDGNKYSLFKKFFGKEEIRETGNRIIYRLGIFRLMRFILKFNPDIIHIINFERFAKISFIHKRFPGTKIYYNVHGIAAFENEVNPNATDSLKKKDQSSELRYFRDSDRLIFLSERSVTTAEKYFQFDRSKSVIIPNGIDLIFHQTGKDKVFKHKERLKLVFTGDANKKEKGFEFLKSSLDKIEFPLDVFVVGENYKLNEVSAKNVSYIFNERMNTEEFAKFLSDKDIFISASSYEQFSLSSVEAMAAGLVTIVTEETGMSAYIKTGHTGFVIKYGDNEELIKVLNILNSDRKITDRISEEAKKIYSLLSWEMVYGKYKKLYE